MKNWKKVIRQTMALVLTAALIGSSPDLFVFAQDENMDQGTGVITAFTEFPEEIRTQTYDTGTAESQINLPETLEVELMVSDNGEKEEQEQKPEEDTTESSSVEEQENQTTEESSKESQVKEDQQEETKTEDQQKPVEESTTESTEENDTTEEPQESDEDIVTSMLDTIVPSVTVHAAETSNKKTVTLEGIRWKIDAAKSDSDTFQSETPASYTYVPVLPETVELDSHTYKLEVGEETAKPEIAVTIREKQDTEQKPVEGTDTTKDPEKEENTENPQDPVEGGGTGEIISVDVSWGNMAYTYSDARWDTELHTYGEGQWTTDDGGNSITVQNKGNAEVSVSYAYSQSVAEVSGSFADTGGNQINSPVTLPEGEEKKVDLRLTGKPSSELNSYRLGTVTIKIGGKE